METPSIVTPPASRSAAVTGAGTAATVAALTMTLGLAATCWVVAVWRMNGMDMGAATRLGSFGFFITVWAAMMAAMMLPAVAPMALAHLAVAKRRGDGALPTVAFVASYLAVWSTVGVVPVLAHLGFARIGEDAAQSRWLPSLAAIVLIVAGAYQFTGWKSVCLDKCRSPFAFIMTHDFPGGIASAARAGVAHGAYCVGCCAALFSVLLVVGLMNLFWMTALFLLVLAERSWKHGLVVAQVAGVVLVQAGIVVILQPAVLFFLASI
jgi:predicted metal-binding membrane protein